MTRSLLRGARVAVAVAALAAPSLNATEPSAPAPSTVYFDPDRRYYLDLPNGWQVTASGEYVLFTAPARSPAEAPAVFGISVQPCNNPSLDVERIDRLLGIWTNRLVRQYPGLQAVGDVQDSRLTGRPALEQRLEARPRDERPGETWRAIVIGCRSYAYFVFLRARLTPETAPFSDTLDTMLTSLRDLTPTTVAQVQVLDAEFRLDQFDVPIHDFLIRNDNQFTIDDIWLRMEYFDRTGRRLAEAAVRLDTAVYPREQILLKNFEILPDNSEKPYSHFANARLRITHCARAFDQGMAQHRRAATALGYATDLPGPRRAREGNDLIVYCRGHELWAMDPSGRQKRRLRVAADEPTHPAWSPDRQRIALVEGGNVVIIDLDDKGAPRTAFLALPKREEAAIVRRRWYAAPSWNRSGTRLYCLMYREYTGGESGGAGRTQIRLGRCTLLDFSLTEVRVRSNPDDYAVTAQAFTSETFCSPTSDLLAFRNVALGATDPSTGEVRRRDEIVVIDSLGTVLKRFPDRRISSARLAWSPDGSAIAYVRLGLRSETNVVVRDLTRGTARQVTRFGPRDGIVSRLDWSLDGRSIVFDRMNRRDKSTDLYRLDLSSGRVVRLTDDGISKDPAWFGG